MKVEKPNWEHGDGLKSMRDIGSLILDTIADLIPIGEIVFDNEKADSVESAVNVQNIG